MGIKYSKWFARRTIAKHVENVFHEKVAKRDSDINSLKGSQNKQKISFVKMQSKPIENLFHENSTKELPLLRMKSEELKIFF